MNRKILNIAVPSIVSNVTVPLLGLIDTAITGHLGSSAYIAAIAVGTSIFSLCYWIFSFLRMGTGGMTAQAFGAGSAETCREVLRKALVIAVVAGMAIIALQGPIAAIALSMMDTSPEASEWARVYFRILVWGAPANLALSALNGWCIGMQDARTPMVVAIGQNVTNILVSCLLVIGLGWKVEGVATGTLVAQWLGIIGAALLVSRNYKRLTSASTNNIGDELNIVGTNLNSMVDDALNSPHTPAPCDVESVTWSRFFVVGRDIFLRTLCLVAVMFSFTVFGTRLGDVTLSVNAILMQLFLLVSYFMDGFAYAAEALGGSMIGRRDARGFTLLTRRLFLWGASCAAIFTLLFAVGGTGCIGLLTDETTVREMAQTYQWVVVLIPAISLGAFIYDGLFIGATATREMLVSIAVATALYFAIALSADALAATLAATGLRSGDWLWVGFLVYLGVRGGVQHLLMGTIKARHFA